MYAQRLIVCLGFALCDGGRSAFDYVTMIVSSVGAGGQQHENRKCRFHVNALFRRIESKHGLDRAAAPASAPGAWLHRLPKTKTRIAEDRLPRRF